MQNININEFINNIKPIQFTRNTSIDPTILNNWKNLNSFSGDDIQWNNSINLIDYLKTHQSCTTLDALKKNLSLSVLNKIETLSPESSDINRYIYYNVPYTFKLSVNNCKDSNLSNYSQTITYWFVAGNTTIISESDIADFKNINGFSSVSDIIDTAGVSNNINDLILLYTAKFNNIIMDSSLNSESKAQVLINTSRYFISIKDEIFNKKVTTMDDYVDVMRNFNQVAMDFDSYFKNKVALGITDYNEYVRQLSVNPSKIPNITNLIPIDFNFYDSNIVLGLLVILTLSGLFYYEKVY